MIGFPDAARRTAQVLAVALVVGLLAAPAGRAAPKRIVALTPFTANTLSALGVRPVGVGEVLGGGYSSKLRGVRRLKLSHPNGPNLEQLAQLNPSLLLSGSTWRKGFAAMRDLGITVKEYEPDSIAQLRSQTRRIGRLVGASARANQLAVALQNRVRKVRQAKVRPTRVLMILGVGRTPFAFLRNSWGGDVVTAAGGRLLTGKLTASGGFARISDEYVVAQNPDVIIAVPHASRKDLPKVAEYLKRNPAWSDTNAVRQDRVFVSTDNSLLQADLDVARTIRRVQTRYLENR